MRVAVVQFAPKFPGREENWRRIERLAADTAADVVVFPELSSCGYMYQSRSEISPFVDGRETLRGLERIAREKHRLIVGGFAERDGDELYNSAYAIDGKETRIFRKIHLWNMEKEIFRPGDVPLSFEFDGHRVGVEVCYDLQFPEMGTWHAHNGVELLLIPMAWAEETGPIEGLYSYNHLAIATAYSHGIFVAVSNLAADEAGAHFPGQSSVVEPNGTIRHLAGGDGSLVAEVDFARVPPAKRPSPRNDLDADPRFGVTPPTPAAPRVAAVPARRRTR